MTYKKGDLVTLKCETYDIKRGDLGIVLADIPTIMYPFADIPTIMYPGHIRVYWPKLNSIINTPRVHIKQAESRHN